MLASDAAAVQPIRRVPGEDERKRADQDTKLESAEDALKGSGKAEADQTRTRSKAAGSAAGGFTVGGAAESGPVTATAAPQTALPNAGFLTQSIHQEAMGSGLTIEPWSEAIQAYRRADAGVNMPLVTQVSV